MVYLKPDCYAILAFLSIFTGSTGTKLESFQNPNAFAGYLSHDK